MMPIYFHLESHLWILYLFFINGFLLHHYFCGISKNYDELTSSLEATVLSAFFVSLLLNGCLMLVLGFSGQHFTTMKLLLPLVSIAMLLLLIFRLGWSKLIVQLSVEYNAGRLCLYLFLFVVLFYNGGLIEQIADSWWHMSLAKKISLESSVLLDYGHLSGIGDRYYPPLWHANLALAHSVSDISIPVFWNSFTAWGGVVKVMGFYLLALSLSGNSLIAMLSATLFVFLPGMGDSYMRISAWPSHIAYAAMFALFYIGFRILDNYTKQEQNSLLSIYAYLSQHISMVIGFVLLAVVILFVHQLELVWFYVGMLAYCVGLILYRFISKQKNAVEPASNDLLSLLGVSVLLVAIGISVYGLVSDWHRVGGNPDRLIVCLLLLCLFILFLFMHIGRQPWCSNKPRLFVLLCLCVSVVLIFFSIDLRQVLSLFRADLAYPSQLSHERPHILQGWWGGELKLPGWHLQLRSALLYSGVLSIPISLILLRLAPSRLTLFLSTNAVIVLLFCVSPYLYQWLTGVMNYHSPWRIATLLFHPIVWATAIVMAWNRLFKAAE